MAEKSVMRATDPMALAVIGIAAGLGGLWCGGVLSALLSGHPVPHRAIGAAKALTTPSDPSAAWAAPVGPAVVYWPLTALVFAVAAAAAYGVVRLAQSAASTGAHDARRAGLASRAEVLRAAGAKALMKRRAVLRPSLSTATPADLGYRLGRSRGVDCWASVEDSVVVLGPPRAGKGLHTVIPVILDAPGAVLTTSTRPDNLTATMAARSADDRPVSVFDPQALAPYVPSATRWSPLRGCAEPRVAMARARALCADSADGTENSAFWAQQCRTAVRCLLHAAALDGREPVELLHWSLSAVAAQDAVDILTAHPQAAATWAQALEAILSADPRQRDSTWAMVANVFAPLADPTVLDAVSPKPGEAFDPETFLRERGTLYLLGTAAGASATANLVAAFVEDVVDAARRLAAASPAARLDPPLAVILDEAANYPLASLPSLMSDGGGSGITTVVVLQSLAQARARWGQQDAQAIWDAAIVKLVLGGSANADDLRDLSALMGTREETRVHTSRGTDGRISTSTSTHEKPVLDTSRLRTLPFGTAVLLLRTAPPILLQLDPWTARRDGRKRRAR